MHSSKLFFACAAFALGACGGDPQAAPDVPPMYPDIRMVPIDGVTNVDLPPVPDVLDERGSTCRTGQFRPCECSPGELGRNYCVNMVYEGMCRCGDAGPPPMDLGPDVEDDAFTPTPDDAQPSVDSGTPTMDASTRG